MLDQLKQLNELRKLRAEALKMQHQLAEEKVELTEGEIRVVVRGDQKIEVVEINGEAQKKLADVLNEALKKAQQKAAMKMAQSGSLGGLSGLLGK
jgi:DNA-binding protein YbaB